MRQAHSNNIPEGIEYLGMSQWAVRWDVKVDTAEREITKGITSYVYNEEIFNEEPNYDLFVTAYLRNYYTIDEENALKSNVIAALLDSSAPNSQAIMEEWEVFEARRSLAKTQGRMIFAEPTI